VSPDFLSCSPMMIRSGFKASWRAEPSRRNSGFMHKPKSEPQCLFECFSRRGLTTFFVVPGTTVLFITTRWYVSFLFRASAISRVAFLMCCRFMLPFGLLGVAVAMNVMSVFKTASLLSSVDLRYPFLTTFCNDSCNFGS